MGGAGGKGNRTRFPFPPARGTYINLKRITINSMITAHNTEPQLLSYLLSAVITFLNRLAIFNDIHQRPLPTMRTNPSTWHKGMRSGKPNPLWQTTMLANG